MNTHLQKNDGFTLIELLATLAIISILSTLIFSVLLDGINYSKKSEGIVSIQEEMNILVTTITKAHQSYPSYDIVVDQNPNANNIQLNEKDATGKVVKTIVISNGNYIYTLYNYQGTRVPLSALTTINTTQPLYIDIVITNKRQRSETFEEKTIISRL